MKLLQNFKVKVGLAVLAVLLLLVIFRKKTSAMSGLNNGLKRMPTQLSVSQNGIAHFKQWEGVRTKAYKDTANLWTTGIGHLIKASEPHLKTKILTMSEVEMMFRQDVKKFEGVVASKIKVPVSQGLFDALVSLAYNTGTIYDSIKTLVEAGDMNALAAKWKTTAITSRGQKTPTQGLINRRAAEVKLFT